MHTKSKVRTKLKNGASSFRREDFASFEEFEAADEYLRELSANGTIEILERKTVFREGQHHAAIVLIQITADGRRLLTLDA